MTMASSKVQCAREINYKPIGLALLINSCHTAGIGCAKCTQNTSRQTSSAGLAGMAAYSWLCGCGVISRARPLGPASPFASTSSATCPPRTSLLLSLRRSHYVMSYALPRTSQGPACFRPWPLWPPSLAHGSSWHSALSSLSSLIYYQYNKARSKFRQPLPRLTQQSKNRKMDSSTFPNNSDKMPESQALEEQPPGACQGSTSPTRSTHGPIIFRTTLLT